MKAIPAAALFVVVSFAAAAARADRLDATIALGGSTVETIDAPGGLATVGFLVTEGAARNLAITVTPKKAKKPATTLIPDVKVIAPDGTIHAFTGKGESASAAGAATWKAKLPSVPQTGLWRLEIRGANGTSGAFTVSVKGKDVLTTTSVPSVPQNGTSDVVIYAGENTTLTVTTKRTASKSIVPRLRIIDANGDALEGGREFVAGENGVLKLTNYRLPTFGRYALRFSAVGGAGGEFAMTAKTAAAKFGRGLPVADARVVAALEPTVSEEDPSGDVEPGFVGTLDATHSSSPSARPLTYHWSQASGPRVELLDADTARPTFVAGEVPTSLAFQLSVSADGVISKSSTVGVEIAKKPIADAGRAQRAALAAAVSLDGDASTDRRGAGLRYVWRQLATDATKVTLRDAATAHPSFDAPATPAELHFGLVVDDGTARSFRDVVVVDVGADRRVAEAGRGQWVAPMATVYLCGLGSAATSDGVLDGGFAWTQTAGPTVALVGADTPWPSFQAPKTAADLAFKLTLDGVDALSDVVAVHVRDDETDLPPTTRGNGPLSAAPGAVALSAAASFDPTNDALSARWSQVAGARLPLVGADATAATTTLAAGNADFAFAVQVNDGLEYGAPDVVNVRNAGYSGRPIAAAGPDVKIDAPGAGVVLDGRNSTRTSGSGALTYQWTQVNGKDWYDVAAKVPTFDPTAARPVFALPATLSSLAPTRTMLFQLVVSDGTTTSFPDFATVTFNHLPSDSPPTVTAGASSTNPLAGQTITLIGTKDDLDTDAADVSVEWLQTQNGAPAVALQPNAQTLSPTFVMPDTTYPLVFRLTAYDGAIQSAPGIVTITMDRKPTATVAVTPTNGPPGTVVTFNATASADPENHALTFRWTQIQPASPPLVADLTTSSISFTAPSGVVKYQLVVNDGRQDSAPTIATFAGVIPPSVSPTASPLDVSVNGAPPFAGDLAGYAAYGANVTLAANATNAGASPTYTWRVIGQQPSAMPTITLSSTTDPSPTFSVPAPGATAFGVSPRPQAQFGVVCHSGSADSVEGTITIYFFASLNNGTTSQASTPANNTVYGIVTPYCAGCHSGTQNYCPVGSGTSSGSAQGLGMATKAAFLANTRNVTACSSTKTRNPAVGATGAALTNSYLYDRITGTATPQMPQGFSSFLPAAKTNLFRDWIDQGCLDN